MSVDLVQAGRRLGKLLIRESTVPRPAAAVAQKGSGKTDCCRRWSQGLQRSRIRTLVLDSKDGVSACFPGGVRKGRSLLCSPHSASFCMGTFNVEF